MPRKKNARKRKEPPAKEKADKKKIKVTESDLGLDQFITHKIFLILSVSSLANCKSVCKKWHTAVESEDLWKQKYIARAELKSDIKDKKRHKTYYRTIFLDRFGREAQMAILYNNFKNTQNRMYLRRLEELALTSSASLKNYGLEIFFDKYSKEKMHYQQITDSVCFATITTHTFQRVCFVAEFVRGLTHVSEFDFWSLYELLDSSSSAVYLFIDDTCEAEYSCSKINTRCYSSVAKNLGIEEVEADEFLEIIKDSCRIKIENKTAPTSTLEQMIQKYEEMENGSTEEKQSWYNNLALLAAGEIRKMEAIEIAKEYKVSPNVLLLLENTVFNSSDEIGKMRPEYCFFQDNCMAENWRICYKQKCCLLLDLPECNPAKFYTSGRCNLLEDKNSGHVTGRFVLKASEKNSIIIKNFHKQFSFLNEKLQQVVNSLNVPGLTTSELFTFLMFCTNMQDFISVYNPKKEEEEEEEEEGEGEGEEEEDEDENEDEDEKKKEEKETKDEKKWWELKSLVGVKFEPNYVETDYMKSRLFKVRENMVFSHQLLKWNGNHLLVNGGYTCVNWNRLEEWGVTDTEYEYKYGEQRDK